MLSTMWSKFVFDLVDLMEFVIFFLYFKNVLIKLIIKHKDSKYSKAIIKKKYSEPEKVSLTLVK